MLQKIATENKKLKEMGHIRRFYWLDYICAIFGDSPEIVYKTKT